MDLQETHILYASRLPVGGAVGVSGGVVIAAGDSVLVNSERERELHSHS